MDPILDEVLELEPALQEDRARELCFDEDLLGHVLSFLHASQDTSGFLQTSAGERSPELVDEGTRKWDPAQRLGQRLGPYVLVEVLGEGGMGLVYLAERADGQFHKKVAIKLMLSLGEGSHLRDRFLNERELLARLEHPNIVRLLDGGLSDDGFPYIVMELVDGIPLVEYAQSKNLNLDQILGLFLAVCEAVDSAHQQFVLHCDLKPSNILVTSKGQVRLLDFGIACCLEKAGQSDGTHQVGNLLTPDFASPEQREGGVLTTATDVFSLGVLLFELVTHHRPFGGLQADQNPQTLLASDAGRRRPWAGRLKGDLENILKTMLKTDPADRYNSVQEVVGDLRRYREHLPVRVTPATPLYLVRKVMGRNKPLTVVVLVAWIALSAAVFSMARSAGIAKRERDLARVENLKTEAVSSFLVELFGNSDPNEKPGEKVTARELLDLGTSRIRTTLADQPEVQGELMFTMAKVYTNLGLYNEAIQLNEEVLAILQNQTDGGEEELAAALVVQGHVLIQKGDYPGAEEFARQAVELIQQLNLERDDSLAAALQVLGQALKEQGRVEDSEAAYRESLALWSAAAYPDTVELASTMASLGELLRVSDRPEDAEPLERNALAMSRAIKGDVHPLVRDCINNLALTVRDLERYEEAEELTLEAVELTEVLFGTNSARMATILNNLGALYKLQKKLDQAEDVHRQALGIRREIFEPGHPVLAGSLNNLAVTLEAKGELEEAAELLQEALIIVRKTRGERHRHVGVSLYNLARIYFKDQRYIDVDRTLAEGYGILEETLPAGHWILGNTKSLRGYSLAQTGKLDLGLELSLAGYEIVRDARGEENVRTKRTLRRLVEVCELMGEEEKAAGYRQLLNE